MLAQSQLTDDGPVRARIIQTPRLSPDGESLVFSALIGLYRMSVPDGEPERIGPEDVPSFQPSWSPRRSLDRVRHLDQPGRPYLEDAFQWTRQP